MNEQAATLFDPARNIVNLLGLESAPLEARLALIEEASALVQRRVALRMIESLNDADAAEAAKLGDDPAKLFDYLAARASNLPLLIEEEATAVREELVSAQQAVDVELNQ